jgi:hypothetical protein
VWPLAAAFVEIAMRRRGPETLPDSSFLVFTLVLLYVLVGLLYFFVQGELTAFNFGFLVIDTVLLFAFVFAVLTFFKLERRFRPTVSALLGADIVITLTYVPFACAALLLGLEVTDPPFFWVLIALFLWSNFIGGFILARALSQPLIVGLMFEILLFLTASSIRDLLTPAAS